MPAAYSLDLRERVVDRVEEGTSRRGAAAVFKVTTGCGFLTFADRKTRTIRRRRGMTALIREFM